jgi:hypothetical protein
MELESQMNVRAKLEEGGKTSVFINTLYQIKQPVPIKDTYDKVYRWEFTTNKLFHDSLLVIDQPSYGCVMMFMNTVTVGDERRVRRGLEVVKPIRGPEAASP